MTTERDPLEEIKDLITAHEGEVSLRVTDLLDEFGHFNLNARAAISQQLEANHIVVDPPLAAVDRSTTVHLSFEAGGSTARPPEITRWVLGRDGEVRTLARGEQPDGVLWIDVEAQGGEAAALMPLVAEALAADGQPLPKADADRLARQLQSHDHRPATHRFGPHVGSVSAFAVAHDEETPEDAADPDAPKTGRITFWPLEMVAGARFLLTVRRAGERISARTRAHVRDDQGQVQRCPVLGAHELEAMMRLRWHAASSFDGDRTGGDAALLVLHWIADGSLAALLELEAWLRQWELHVLEHHGTPERVTLTTLRDMLAEMEARFAFFGHPHAEDPVNGWVPAVTEADEAQQTLAIIRRVVRTIEQLQSRVRDRLVGVAHIGDERRGEKVAAGGFVLLFPALILGVFSANTNTPGRDSWVGFAVMLVVMAGLTFGAFRFLSRDR